MTHQQTKKYSALETAASTAAGFIISILLSYYALPLWGFEPSKTDALGITILFTGVSLVRGYMMRRLFNRFENECGLYSRRIR